jgi:signal transduction histidine kinase
MDALKLNPWAALVRPNISRLLWHMAGYLVWSSLFLFGLEEAAGIPDMRLGLLKTALACLGIAGPCLITSMLAWYVLVRGRWLRDPQLRARVERDGMYAALPWWQHLALGVAVTLATTSQSHQAWVWFMNRHDLWGQASPLRYTLANSLTVGGFGTVVLFAIDFIRVRQLQERVRTEATQRQLAEAQLHRLQAQLEPHMLFNTLSNLHALIETQPGRAQDMLAHLIDFLRATLGATRGGAFTLADEMRLVRDYLALMQIRMGTRLQVDIAVPEAVLGQAWPPMLLQPLVENAIRHGLDPLPEGGKLQVRVSVDRHVLCVEVQDDGVGLPAAELATDARGAGGGSSSFGLNNVRERLHTTFGDAASLSLKAARPRGTVVTLRIPLPAH